VNNGIHKHVYIAMLAKVLKSPLYSTRSVVDDSKTTVVKVNLAGLTLSENVQLWGLTLRTSVVSGSYAYFG